MKLLLWSLVSLASLIALSQSGLAQSQFTDEGFDEIKIERVANREFRADRSYQFKCGQVYTSVYWKSCSRGECAEGYSPAEATNNCHKQSNYPESCGKPIKISNKDVYRCDD